MSANIPDVFSQRLNKKGTLYITENPKLLEDIMKCLSDMFNTKLPLNAKISVLAISEGL